MRLPTRLTASFAAAALVAGAGLVAAGPAAADGSTATAAVPSASPAAAGRFDSLTISGLKKKNKLPKSGKTRNVKFTVNIAGSPSDDSSWQDINGDGLKIEYKAHDVDYSSAKVVKIKSKVKQSSLPRVTAPSPIGPGANTYTLQIPYYVAPGIYEVRVPVTQNDWTTSPRKSTTKVVTKRFQVHATKKISRAQTSFYAPSWKPGKTAKFTFNAPVYQKGAKVTLFYKTAKAKKFTKVTSKKLKAKGTATRSKAILKTKKLRPGHKIYFKVTKTKWAPGYKTKKSKIVRL